MLFLPSFKRDNQDILGLIIGEVDEWLNHPSVVGGYNASSLAPINCKVLS